MTNRNEFREKDMAKAALLYVQAQAEIERLGTDNDCVLVLRADLAASFAAGLKIEQAARKREDENTALRAENKQLQNLLRDANRGAELNNGVNRLLIEETAALRARVAELEAALDTLTLVVGLTAFKHEGQRAALQEAMDKARAALGSKP